VSYFNRASRSLPDQPTRTVDPEVERLVHVMVNGMIDRLAAEPAVPAASLLDNVAAQLQQAANLRRLGVVRRTTSGPPGEAPATPRRRHGANADAADGAPAVEDRPEP
jgi:hypothetical protein